MAASSTGAPTTTQSQWTARPMSGFTVALTAITPARTGTLMAIAASQLLFPRSRLLFLCLHDASCPDT